MARVNTGRIGEGQKTLCLLTPAAIIGHQMVCAIDGDTAVYPDAIRAQADAGIVTGLSTGFYDKVRFANGGVKTVNYSDAPLTMSEVPEIDVHIAENDMFSKKRRRPIDRRSTMVLHFVPSTAAGAPRWSS